MELDVEIVPPYAMHLQPTSEVVINNNIIVFTLLGIFAVGSPQASTLFLRGM